VNEDAQDVDCIGIPRAEMGEALRGLVVLRANQPRPDESELIDYCRAHFSNFKCPKTIEYREHPGRNAMGKVDKRALRAPFWQREKVTLIKEEKQWHTTQ